MTSDKTAEYAKILYEARKAKGMTEDEAKEQAKDRTMFGALMLKAGDVISFAVLADVIAMSASCSAVGSILIAQSAKTATPSGL